MWSLRAVWWSLSSSCCLFYISNTAGSFFTGSQQIHMLTSFSSKHCGSYSGFTEGQASISPFSVISSRQENLRGSSWMLRSAQENTIQHLQPWAFWEPSSPQHTHWKLRSWILPLAFLYVIIKELNMSYVMYTCIWIVLVIQTWF